MAIFKTKTPALMFSGKVGDLVFKKVGDRMIVCRRPRRSSSSTEKQRAQRERFRIATLHAKAKMLEPDARAKYEEIAAREKISAYTVAVRDFLNRPEGKAGIG